MGEPLFDPWQPYAPAAFPEIIRGMLYGRFTLTGSQIVRRRYEIGTPSFLIATGADYHLDMFVKPSIFPSYIDAGANFAPSPGSMANIWVSGTPQSGAPSRDAGGLHFIPYYHDMVISTDVFPVITAGLTFTPTNMTIPYPISTGQRSTTSSITRFDNIINPMPVPDQALNNVYIRKANQIFERKLRYDIYCQSADWGTNVDVVFVNVHFQVAWVKKPYA